MSYCVNCGVELDSTAKKCALCDNPVYNPLQKEEKDAPTPFSQTPVIPTNIKQKFVALIVTYIFLIPNLVCIFLKLFHKPRKPLVYICSVIKPFVLDSFCFSVLYKKITPISDVGF